MCRLRDCTGSGKAPITRGKCGGHGMESGGANPGLQATRDDMFEREGRIRARSWMGYGVKFVRWKRKKKKRPGQR